MLLRISEGWESLPFPQDRGWERWHVVPRGVSGF